MSKRKAEEILEAKAKRSKELELPAGQASSSDENWVLGQKKSFTRWVNHRLALRGLHVDEITTDFKDGLNLHGLVEIISGKKIRVNAKPRVSFQQMENLTWVFDFLKAEKLKIVGIGTDSVSDGNQKLILGLIWTLILRYQIQTGDGVPERKALLEWVRSMIPEYDIQNFARDWQSGKALCALSEAVHPGQFNLPADFANDPLTDANKGIDSAFQTMNIPTLVDADDMVHHPDELSNMTYISFFRDYYTKNADAQLAELAEKTPWAANCEASGQGLKDGNDIGQEVAFEIEAKNQAGRRVPVGGHLFTVAITSNGQSLPSKITDNKNGSYKVVYTPTTAQSKISIAITFNGEHIKSSPFEVTTSREKPSASHCLVEGPGIQPSLAESTPATFVIQSKGAGNNKLSYGGANYQVSVKGPNSTIPGTVKDNGDGTYSCQWVPGDSLGKYVVSVTLEGAHVASSPYTVVTKAAGCAGKSFVQSVLFTIKSVDKRGNPMTVGGDKLEGTVEGPKGPITAKVVDKGDGAYHVSYEAASAGEYKVKVFLEGEEIGGSPFVTLVKERK